MLPLHGNSKKVTEIPKISCEADFKRKFQPACFLLTWWKVMERQGKKQFIKQNEGTPIFSTGHCELIISSTESNGDPHGL